MSENLWGEEEPFSDVPDEVNLDNAGNPIDAPQAQVRRTSTPPPKPQQQAQEYETSVEQNFLDHLEQAVNDGEDEFANIFQDANLRLEQGSLWKTVMQHELFDGVDADPKAIQSVQKAIRKFAKEQMEIMLGMRQEIAKVETLNIDFPFNELEIKILKGVVSKMTDGESDRADRYVPNVTRTTEDVPTIPKRQTLNTIGSRRAAPAPTQRANGKPLQRKPQTPVKRSRLDATIDQIAREEGIPRELLEEDLPGIGSSKSWNEMTDAEKFERNRLIALRRGTQVKSDQALPMPSNDHMEQIAISRAAAASGVPGSLTSRLLDAVKAMPPSLNTKT
jgi:hypothetical protein